MTLDELIQAAMNEIGVPQPGYPAPVANAYEHLEAARAIIAKGEEWLREPDWPAELVRKQDLHKMPEHTVRVLVIPLDKEAS